MSFPTEVVAIGCDSSSESTLNEARGCDPGWVDNIPRNRVMLHERTWLSSEQTAIYTSQEGVNS